MSDAQPSALLPPPETYEAEYSHWPWADLVNWVIDYIIQAAPHASCVVDYMCGTGFVAGRIKERRPDLLVVACDILASYVEYGATKYRGIKFHKADARTFLPPVEPSVIVCTGGVHHLPFHEQSDFLRKMGRVLLPAGVIVIGEVALPQYQDDRTRSLAALELGRELLAYGIDRQWPDSMVRAAIDVLRGDLTGGECKRSVVEWRELLEREYRIKKMERFWSPKCGGGDIVFICERQPI